MRSLCPRRKVWSKSWNRTRSSDSRSTGPWRRRDDNNFKPRETTTKHTHDTKSGVILSSFYYVCTGNPVSDEWTGHTWFESRGNIPDYFRFQPELFSRTVDNKPKEGELILFPSWLPHGVREYRGEGERISIAVNLWHRDISLTKSTDQPSPQWAWRCFPGLMNRLKQWRDN